LPLPSNERFVDDLASLIETRVPAGRASVVGVSWGAWLAQVLIRRHPERVDRVISDGTPIVWPGGVVGRTLIVGLYSAMVPFLHTRPMTALFRDIVDAEDLRRASRRAYWRAVKQSMEGFLASARPACPTLFVAGEKEGYIRPPDAALATLMPHAEAWYAPGLDHCWQRKAPDLHIRMVEAWCLGQALPPELRRELPPTPEALERLRQMGNWYLGHRSRIMREVRFALPHFRKRVVEAYGKAEGEAIAREAMQRFEALLPDLPYIGGDENRNTSSLYGAAAMLAMYRSLQARGASVEEAARLIYLGTASFFGSVPTRWLLRWQGRRMAGRKHQDQLRHAAAISQERRHLDDWVFEVVDGDGRDFVSGVDYTECGIVKYLVREGAPELAPYLCWIDYPSFAAMHLRLDRTETIAQGGQRCDFRLSRGRPVQIEPEFLHV
jgi:hypothetical protein